MNLEEQATRDLMEELAKDGVNFSDNYELYELIISRSFTRHSVAIMKDMTAKQKTWFDSKNAEDFKKWCK